MKLVPSRHSTVISGSPVETWMPMSPGLANVSTVHTSHDKKGQLTPLIARLLFRPPPSQPTSTSEDSESDDEISLHRRSSLRLIPGNDSSRPIGQGKPPPLPSAGPPTSLYSRLAVPLSRPVRSSRTQRFPANPPRSLTAEAQSEWTFRRDRAGEIGRSTQTNRELGRNKRVD